VRLRGVESNIQEVVDDARGFLFSADGEKDGHDTAHHMPEEGLPLNLKAAEFIVGGGRGGGRGGREGGGVATAATTAGASTTADATAAAGERFSLRINHPLPFSNFQNLCFLD